MKKTTFALLCLLSSDCACAGLIGDQVQLDLTLSSTLALNTPGFNGPVTVTGGEELALDLGLLGSTPLGEFFVDVGNDTVDVGIRGGGFGGHTGSGFLLTLSDLDWVGQEGIVTGVQLVQSQLSNVTTSFTDDSVTFDTVPDNVSPGNFENNYLLQVEHTTPEPSTWMLAMVAIGLMLGSSRFRTRRVIR